MDNVAESVEGDEIYRQVIEAQRTAARSGVSDAITVAAREVAETTQVKAICCFSHSGTTALLAARERPRVPIIALTPLVGTARRLALSWGLHSVLVPEVDRFKMAVVSAARVARGHGFAGEDDRIVVTAGIPFGVAGSTNILRVATCQRAGDLRGRRRGLTAGPAGPKRDFSLPRADERSGLGRAGARSDSQQSTAASHCCGSWSAPS